MVTSRQLTLWGLDYQNYLTYLSVAWTIAISLFVAVVSYLFTSYNRMNPLGVISLIGVVIVIEGVLIATLLYYSKEMDKIKSEIKNSK